MIPERARLGHVVEIERLNGGDEIVGLGRQRVESEGEMNEGRSMSGAVDKLEKRLTTRMDGMAEAMARL